MDTSLIRMAFMACLPPPSGGIANVTQTYFESLPSLGYDLLLIDVGERDPNRQAGKLSFYNVLRVCVHFWKLVVSLIRFKPEYINIMFSARAISKFGIFVFVSKLFSVKVIGQMHDGWIDKNYVKYSNIRRKYVSFIFRMPDYWIVLGESWRKFMIKASVTPDCVVVIKNAVKEQFAEVARVESVSRDTRPLRILYVGAIGHQKGIDVLLDALVGVVEKGYEFRMQLVGGEGFPGERSKYVEEYEARLDSSLFEFISHTEGKELIDLFRTANIFVLPSKLENLPVCMLEAMACSLPVVISNVGAVDEVVVTGFNGILVPPEDPQALQEAIIRLLEDPSLRMILGKNAQKTIREIHMPESVGRQLDAFLQATDKKHSREGQVK